MTDVSTVHPCQYVREAAADLEAAVRDYFDSCCEDIDSLKFKRDHLGQCEDELELAKRIALRVHGADANGMINCGECARIAI